MSPRAELQEDLPPERVAELLREDDVQLVDVRETYEHEAGRIAGARHVELGSLAEHADALDRERPLVFYCRVGSRSAMAAQAFRAARLRRLQPRRRPGAWVERGLPLEPEGGRVAEH